MKKTSPQNIKADWCSVEKRATWSLITSPELAKILGVHLQTIANWRMRGILPPPEPASPKLKGNVIRYRISTIRAFLENRTEDEIHWDFINKQLASHKIPTIAQAKFFVKNCYDLLGLEKPI